MAAADRDLLFGLIALQNGLIDQEQLLAAFRVRTLEAGSKLADHLRRLGHLEGERAAAVDAMVALHLKQESHAPQPEFAQPSDASTRRLLPDEADSELTALVDHLGPEAKDGDVEVEIQYDDPDRTALFTHAPIASDGRRYRILRTHAQGGLGTVFVALDSELHREVALKRIVEKHADDRASRQRFLLEAEVTGNLEHPGIVPVYGLGTNADGRPFYAMRLIKGDSLGHAICRFHEDDSLKRDDSRRSLELRKLLRRFQDVCNAIDYAHGRGVLHRDIKPSNIVVGKHGETLVVDWGLAKVTGLADPQDVDNDGTLMPTPTGDAAETQPGSAIGTPAYMSPEQARGDTQAIGRRSDVYSLGATLYCLLTGKAPFGNGAENIVTLLHQVRHGHFRPPSELAPDLDPALEAICVKAMSLKPDARYATARAFADEIERWAADEPISAWREPWTNRLGRWARRNRAWMLAGATSLLLVAVIAIVSAVVIDRARRHERKEKVLAGRALAAEKVAKAEARRERAQAETNYRLARGAVDQLVTRLAENRRLQDPANATLRLELIGLARRFYLQFIRQGGPDAIAKFDLASSYQKLAQAAGVLGDPTLAIDQSHHAIAILTQLARSRTHGQLASLRLAETLDNLGKFLVQARRFEEAERTYLKALKLVDRPEDWPDPDQADARQHLESSIRGDLALAQMDLGQLDRANQSLDSLLESDEGYSKSRPGDLEARDGLATTLARLGLALMARGRLDRADPLIRRAAALTASPADTPDQSPGPAIRASTHASLLGDLDMLLRRFAPALDDYDAAIRQAEACLATGIEAATARSALSRALAGRAGALAVLGHYPESLAAWDLALEHADPREAPIIRLGRAETLAERGDYPLAIATLESLLKGLPESPDIPFFAARAYAVSSQAAARDLSLTVAHRQALAERYAHAAIEHLSLALRHRAGSEPRNLIDLRHARGWDPMRNRRDFQDLMLDLAFPKNPFATDVRTRQ